MYRLSRRHNVAPVIIDKVKKRFDHFDADKSGVIDYAEFLEMLCTLLRCKNKEDLSENRVTRSGGAAHGQRQAVAPSSVMDSVEVPKP